MRWARLPLIALALLGLACATLDRLRGEEGSTSGTGAGTAEPTEPEAQPGEATPTQVRRLELQATPTPFHVLSQDDPRVQLNLAQPDYFDYFDKPDTWFDYDTQGRGAYQFEDGRLLGIDYEPEELNAWWSYTGRQSGNVYAEITATNGDCIGKDSVGLAIRVNPESGAGGYALEVSCDGHWRFRRHRPGKEPVEIVEWTPSDAIETGKDAANRLGIWGYQGAFVLFVNGQQVGEPADPTYPYTYGMFAVYVRASQTFDLSATFDDFAYWNIPFQP